MKLTVARRTKKENKQIRREGNIPAILYSKGEKGQEIVVDGIAFKKILNTTPTGTLSSKVFHLDIDGKVIKALVKEIQYNKVTYAVIHLDFERLHDEHLVSVKIPLRCINVADCVGIKLGGVVRQVVRHVPVVCLPKDIPAEFEIDLRDLVLGQMVKLSALKIPPGVRPTISLKEVAIVIARK
ncbi:50S ribosomal protein L25 [Chlamydiota bacterium]